MEYDPSVVAYEELLEVFWKTHDPTQVKGIAPRRKLVQVRCLNLAAQ